MATTSDVFVDTNVLVYAADESSERHEICFRLCERALNGETSLCLSPQILAEFISVTTNPNALPRPLSIEEAREHAQVLSEAFRIIVAPQSVTARYFELLRETGAKGKRAHDVLHAATMLENGIEAICTFDAGFTRIPGIVVRTPDEILTEAT